MLRVRTLTVPVAFVAIVALVAVLGMAGGLAACKNSKGKSKPGCTKDTDCKGERVCEKSECVEPKGAMTKAPDLPAGKRPTARTRPRRSPGPAMVPWLNPGGPGGSIPPKVGKPGGPNDLKICVQGQCLGIGKGFGGKPQDISAILGLFQRVIMGGLLGQGKPLDLQFCIRGRCVKLGKNLFNNPQALMDLLQHISPNLMQRLRRTPLFRGGKQPPTTPPPPGAKTTYSDFGAIKQAGDAAIGKIAELKGLSIISVTDTRLVVEGADRAMILLNIPAGKKALAAKLRVTTNKIQVRFQIQSKAIGKLLRGEIMSFK